MAELLGSATAIGTASHPPSDDNWQTVSSEATDITELPACSEQSLYPLDHCRSCGRSSAQATSKASPITFRASGPNDAPSMSRRTFIGASNLRALLL